MKIRNWKLSLLAFLFFCLFISLGCWQLNRAHQKTVLVNTYAKRALYPPLTTLDLSKKRDYRFYRATFTGTFDNAHSLLLDNKIYRGLIGYELYTPFITPSLSQPILVDRGFVAMGAGRDILPTIKNIAGIITITGMLNLPPTYVALSGMMTAATLSWPLRVEYLNLSELSNLRHQIYTPYVLLITPTSTAAYPIEWKIVTMGPERHRGYAVQWFAFALTLLILFIALNRETKKPSEI